MLALPFLEKFGISIHHGSSIPQTGVVIGFASAASAPVFIFIFQTVHYERSKKQLRESSRVIETARLNKSRFLANVTHEIRTPMNAIIGMNELILREDLDPEARELAENIKQSSNQLLKIINNILEFSKLDSNKMELYPAKYDFRELMTEIISDVSSEYASENTDFFARIDPNIPKTLFGDNIRIKQVFMYLLFSTVHKLPHSRHHLQLRVHRREESRHHVLKAVKHRQDAHQSRRRNRHTTHRHPRNEVDGTVRLLRQQITLRYVERYTHPLFSSSSMCST